MIVEIKMSREDSDTEKSIREGFIKLSDSSFPFGIMKAGNKNVKPRTCFWTGTLEQFVRLVEIKESYKIRPDKLSMFNEMREEMGLPPLEKLEQILEKANEPPNRHK